MTGFFRIKIKANDRADFLAQCQSAYSRGYRLYQSDVKILWPYFWRRQYRARFKKPLLYIDGMVIEYSQNEIDLIKRSLKVK